MSLTIDEVKDFIYEYVKQYSVARTLQFRIREDAADLYGANIYEHFDIIKAAYEPYAAPNHDDYVGRIDIVTSTATDLTDLIKSLNHEIIGHYGLNTFTPEEKKLLLDSIISSKSELTDLWDYVEYHYQDSPLYLQAEEVFCLVAENIQPEMHRKQGQHAFTLNPLTRESLDSLVLATAEGIAFGTRVQRTFPIDDVTRMHINQFNDDLTHEDELER